jgi:hydrogenase maturation protease
MKPMLIAGIGNIFLGDDGFGVEVAGRLGSAGLPDWVRVADYGIAGMHLAYDLAEGYQTTILVDAMARGEAPGTVYVLEVGSGAGQVPAGDRPGAEQAEDAGQPDGLVMDAHGMQPDVVLRMLSVLGGHPGRVLVVGCEPLTTEEGIGLSDPVAAAVDRAVGIVVQLVTDAAPGVQPDAAGRRPAASAGPATMKE